MAPKLFGGSEKEICKGGEWPKWMFARCVSRNGVQFRPRLVLVSKIFRNRVKYRRKEWVSHISEMVLCAVSPKICILFEFSLYGRPECECGLERCQPSFQLANSKETELANFCDLFSKTGRVFPFWRRWRNKWKLLNGRWKVLLDLRISCCRSYGTNVIEYRVCRQDSLGSLLCGRD